ncbi:MAG: ferrous iron transport protein A [Desulfovibrionaceae bacterium]|nr:ferrous iron transport protein A [Desulfovibrionaceae bacterium]
MEIRLSKAASCGKFRVKKFAACLDERRRLCALGFTQGAEFELKCRECSGTCHVQVKGCGLILDSASADCIICEPLSFPS